MDTPERNRVRSPLSMYEDSPVFNYLSNLSPIKPVKLAPISQTFTSLNFSSLPSIVTSPHITSHTESRFLRRHKNPDKSQSDVSYFDVRIDKENELFVDSTQLRNYSNELHKVLGAFNSLENASLELLNEESALPMELSQNFMYYCNSPESGSKAHHSAEAATSSVMFDQGPSTSVTDLHEAPSCWENLFSDNEGQLLFDSLNIDKDLRALLQSPPGERAGSSLASQFPQDTSDFLKSDSTFLVDIGQFQNEGHQLETEGVCYAHDEYPNTMTECTISHPIEHFDDELTTSLHRGARRRRLVFDTNGAQRKNLLSASTANPSMSNFSDQKISSSNNKRDTSKTSGGSSLCILPGIGLHLAASWDHGVQISVPTSAASFKTPTTAQEFLHDDSGIVQGSEDASLEFEPVDDFNSPRKKRRKQESSVDKSCKRCHCKRSKCLKLYCECFAAGVYCLGACACQNCFNNATHEDTVLATREQIQSRNPLAFAPKVIRTSDPLPDVKEVMNTPSSARHKRGCNCKKSSCQKKYCECYQGGVGCSVNCRCESCKNVFSTKDGKPGSAPVAQQDDDEEETENMDMSQNNEEHDKNTFPVRLTRMSVQLPFSSKDKPLSSAFLTVSSAAGAQACNGSTGSVTSPSARKSTRKLILQSIPSFPSLTQP